MIHRFNGFDGLRLLAATLVIFGHSFALTGGAPPRFFGNGVQAIGVKIFFVISGYLIARSWQSDPNLLHFALKRALRLMPGLIAVCLVTVLALGPLTTSLPLIDYFRDGQTARYLWNLALYPIFVLPGVFSDNIYPNAVNGALWTLPVEVALYCGVPLLFGRRRPSAPFLAPVAALALLAASIYFLRVAPPPWRIVLWGNSLIPTLDIDYYFYAGASIAILRLDRFCHPMAAATIFLVTSQIFTGVISSELALAATLPYLTISLGKTDYALLRRLHGEDYSYGLYLYGFPVQQSMVHFLGAQPAWFNMMVSLPVAALLAALSWFVVERRALVLKPERNARKADPNTGPVKALDEPR